MVVIASERKSPRYTAGSGNGIGAVTGNKGIMNGFRRLSKAGYAALSAKVCHIAASSGKYFMGVGLVSHIKYHLVGRGVKDPVHGKSELHCAEIGGKVTAVFIHRIQYASAYLPAEFFAFRIAEFFQILRQIKFFKHCITFIHSKSLDPYVFPAEGGEDILIQCFLKCS